MVDEAKNTNQPTITNPQPMGGASYGKEQGGFIQESHPRVEIAPELVGYMEPSVSHDEIEVPFEAQKVGLTPAKESVPVSATPTGTIKIPYTREQALGILKVHKAVGSAVVWLAQWCVKQLKLQERKVA